MNREDMNQIIGMTEDEMNRRGVEWETDTWEGSVGEVTLGRPKLFDEDMETVSFRLPLSRIHAVEAVTKRFGINKSEFFRQAIDKELFALTARGE